jgi:hypothetical protein
MGKVGRKCKHQGRRKKGKKKRRALKFKNHRKRKTKRTGRLFKKGKGGKRK